MGWIKSGIKAKWRIYKNKYLGFMGFRNIIKSLRKLVLIFLN